MKPSTHTIEDIDLTIHLADGEPLFAQNIDIEVEFFAHRSKIDTPQMIGISGLHVTKATVFESHYNLVHASVLPEKNLMRCVDEAFGKKIRERIYTDLFEGQP